MRKAINIAALIFFIWLVLDAFNVMNIFLNFLLVGELPGTKYSLSPTQMLAIITALTGLVLIELFSHRFSIIRRIRKQTDALATKSELPQRRLKNV